MIDILLFSSRGHCRQQQDAISVGSEVIQANEHLSQHRASSHTLLLGLADGVATSPAAARASKLAQGFLSQSLAVMASTMCWGMPDGWSSLAKLRLHSIWPSALARP